MREKKFNYISLLLKGVIIFLLIYSWHLNVTITDCEKENTELKSNNDLLESEVDRLQEENQIFSSMLDEKEIESGKELKGSDDKPLLPKHFYKVPEGNNVYRSNQPSLTQLKYILETMDIDKVVRLNGTEGTGVSPQKEKELVESLGKKYYYTNAHISYEDGKGYVGSIELVQPILEKGNVLIHCTAGKDRTGYMVGKFLLNKGWDKKDIWEYTTNLNEWEYYICDGKLGYIKYMEAFYPLDEWCEDFNNNCKYCE